LASIVEEQISLSYSNRLTLLVFVFGFIVALSGCSFFREQVAVSTAADCVDRNCAHQEGAAREQCSVECASRYGQ
jgi:hypothetical protein